MLIRRADLYKYISPCTVEQGVKIYEFKITLRKTDPKVERQILVQGDYTLEQLGRVVGCAIGWHRNPFDLIDSDCDGTIMKGDRPWGHDHNRYDTDSEDESDTEEPSQNEAEATKPKTAREIYISEYFVRRKKTLVMDYGKYRWFHDIRLVKIHERDRKHYPKCIGGKNACPPYGCGHPEEYKDFLKSIKDPKHKSHKDTKFFLMMSGQSDFKPTKFKRSDVVFAN